MKLQYAGLALLLAGSLVPAQQNQGPSDQQQIEQMRQQIQQERQRLEQQAQQQRQQMERQQHELQQAREQIEQERQRMQQDRRQMQQQRQQVQGPSLPAMERALGGMPGRWWDRPDVVQRLVLTSEQQKKLDEVFQQARLKLIDLNAVVAKEELIMEPLVAAEQPDETKIVAQIDKIAQARAELEKANVRMLLGIRRVLTQEQWNNLKAATPGGSPLAPAPPQPPRPAPPPGPAAR